MFLIGQIFYLQGCQKIVYCTNVWRTKNKVQRTKSMNLHKIILVLIAVMYCALSVMYAILTPPWESPDEPAHYLYVSQLATLASSTEINHTANKQVFQGPGFHLFKL